MRVYLAPCGVGLGHVSRCEPIVHSLQANGNQVAVSTYLDGLDYAKRKRFDLLPAVPIGFKVKPDGTIDFKMTAARSGLSLGLRTLIRQTLREIRNLKGFRPHVVVSDSRVTPLIAARLLGIPSVVILNQFRVEIVKRPTAQRLSIQDKVFFLIANIFWIFIRTLIGGTWGLAKLIIIPDLPQPHTISLGNLAIPRRYQDRVRLVGPIVTARPGELPSREELKERLGFERGKPLIYAAISGPKVERTYLADKLEGIFSQFSDDYQVVLSRANPDGGNGPKKVRGLVIYDWIEDEFEYMKACDLVIGRAGHGTIMKALTFGRPMILIPIPDHTEQYGNARRAVAMGVASMLSQDGLSRETLLAEVKTILNPGQHVERAEEIAGSLARFNALRTVEGLLTALGGDREKLERKRRVGA